MSILAQVFKEPEPTLAQTVSILFYVSLSYLNNPFAKPPAVLGRLKAVERILE